MQAQLTQLQHSLVHERQPEQALQQSKQDNMYPMQQSQHSHGQFNNYNEPMVHYDQQVGQAHVHQFSQQLINDISCRTTNSNCYQTQYAARKGFKGSR